MPLITFEYDYKDGRLVRGTTLLDTDKIKILGRRQRQIIEVINRADRTDGLLGGTIEMLIVQQGTTEFGSTTETVESLEACICFPRMCEMGICLDACSLVLDDCCITLR